MLSSSKQAVFPLPNNEHLITSVRETMQASGENLEKIEHLQRAALTICDQLKFLIKIPTQDLPAHLRAHVASAPVEPQPDTAETIKAHTITNLCRALNGLLAQNLPHVSHIVEQLRVAHDTAPLHSKCDLYPIIEAGERALATLSLLKDAPITSLESAYEIATFLASFSHLSGDYIRSEPFTTELLRDAAGKFVKELETHCQSLSDNQLETHDGAFSAHEIAEFRLAVLAIDLYETERADRHGSNARHLSLNHDPPETLDSPNELYLTLPPAHSIDVPALTKTLTTIVADEPLAQTLATTLRDKASWFQITLPLVQGLLEMSSENFDRLLQHWKLHALEGVTTSATSCNFPPRLLTSLLTTNAEFISLPHLAIDYVHNLGRYITQLAPHERYVPVISPYLSPERFLHSSGLESAKELLDNLRSGKIPPASTKRIIAETAVQNLLAPYVKDPQRAAIVLVYSFCASGRPRESTLTLDTLLRGKVQRHADLRHLNLTSMIKKLDGLDSSLAGPVENLEDLGLLKVNRPRFSADVEVEDALHAVTVSLADKQTSVPPDLWTLVVDLIEATSQPAERMYGLLKRIADVKKRRPEKQKERSRSSSKQKNNGSWNDILPALDELGALLKDIDPAAKQHTLRRELNRISTKMSNVTKVVLTKDSPNDAGVAVSSRTQAETLLSKIKPPSKIEGDIIQEYRTLALAALTALQNLFANTEEPSEV